MSAPSSLILGATVVDLGTRRLSGPSGDAVLSENEARLLSYLAERAGIAVSRDELQVAVLGYSPISLSRAIDAAISRIRAKIEPKPSDPIYLCTIYGVGYRLDVEQPPLPQALLPVSVAADDIQPTPGFGAAWVGRTAELATLAKWLANPGVFAVTGPPGIGKSRLILAAAAAAPPALFRYVDLRGIPPAAVGTAIARALGGGPAMYHRPQEIRQAAAALPPGCCVVLDPADGVASLSEYVEAIRQGCPSARVVMGRRAPVADMPCLRLEGLPNEEAVALFFAVSGATSPGLDDAGAILALVDAVWGNPLAIHYLARRSAVLRPEQLLERLRERPDTLSADPEGDGVSGRFAWAWGLLTDRERQAVHELSLFHRAFTLEDAERVVSGGRVVATLTALVETGLVQPRGHAGFFEVYPLFRLSELARTPPPDAEAAQQAAGRWDAWCDALARGIADVVPTIAVLHRAKDHESDLRARFDAVVAAGPSDAIGPLAVALARPLERLGPASDLLALLDQALTTAVSSRGDELRLMRATLIFNTGLRDRGVAELDTLLADPHADAPWRVFATAMRQTIELLELGDAASAIQTLEYELTTAKPGWWTSRARYALGQMYAINDQYGLAVREYRRAAAGFAAVEDAVGEAQCWAQLGLAYVGSGQAAAARSAIERAAAMRQRNGRWSRSPNADVHRASALHELGDLDAAERLFRDGLARAEAAGLPTVAYDSELGWLLIERGVYAEGVARLARVVQAYRAASHDYNLAVAAGALACGWLALGDGIAAEALLASVISETLPANAPFPLVWLFGVGAISATVTGQPEEAARRLAQFEALRVRQLSAAVPLVDVVSAFVGGRRASLTAQLPSSLVRVAYRLFGEGGTVGTSGEAEG